MAVPTLLALSRRLQAPVAALLLIAGVQLAASVADSAPRPGLGPVTRVRASLPVAQPVAQPAAQIVAQPVGQIVAERS